MNNTQRLEACLAHAIAAGVYHVDFMVGRYTGNGTSVVAALRRRGYRVSRHGAGYRMEHRMPTQKDFLAALGPCGK